MIGSRRNPSSARVPSAAAVPEKWRSQAGFSLAELIVSLFVVVLLIVMILLIFDSTTKLARAQTYVAELQQSVRVAQDEMVRATRMAARGGLGRGNLPNGMVSVSVRNNVQNGSPQQDIGIGVVNSPKVMPNTDVLTVRGIYATLYHVNSDPDAGTFIIDDPDNPTRGEVWVQNPVPSTGIPQSLQPLIAAVNADRPEPLLLVSPLGGVLYHIVELDHQNSDVTNPSRIKLAFTITPAGGGTYNTEYSAISASVNFPTELRAVAQLGIVEEYRYYVRQIVDPLNPAGDATTRLSRARFYPGTQVPHPSNATMMDDIADDVIDLQVALAIDANADNAIAPETTPPAANDEWLYNRADDDPNNANWNGTGKNLFYVRINTLARAARRDFQYVAPPIARIEDRVYPATVDVADSQRRRRLLQTVVELRNL